MGSKQAVDLFTGSGEMAQLMRAHDWSKTPLGDPAAWPQSLRAALSICIGSRFPIAIYWGRDLALLYNDAWSPIPGTKHPWALGRPATEVWPEIWEAIGPLFEQVQTTGEATYVEDALLLMHRHGYTEECYFNYTFTPIRGETGEIQGVFNAVIETTYRVIGERRTRLLRDLGERIASVRSSEDACRTAAESLTSDGTDVSFCLIYGVESDGIARLLAMGGLPEGHKAAPAEISLAHAPADSWPLHSLAGASQVGTVSDLRQRFGDSLPGGRWPEPARAAMIAPIQTGLAGRPFGFLVLGASPRRAVDDEYLQFASRAASQIAAAVANAAAYQVERDRAEALAALDRSKTAFFSNVSHEFRTPLTLMLGPLEDILATPDAGGRPDHREQLTVVHRNSLRLLKMVNTLLDFSRIEAGRMQAVFAPTDIAAATAELAGVFRAAIEKAGMRLIIDCAPIDAPVLLDRNLWEKIVLNLVSNAFKFTFEGEIEVRLRAVSGAVELRVRDTGVGIPEKDLPQIFERFHRVEGARRRSYEGTGIGLALVHELSKLHGGSVTVESVEGRGSAFTVAVPIGSAHLPLNQIQDTPTPSSSSVMAATYADEAVRWLPDTEAAAAVTNASAETGAGGVPDTGRAEARPRVVVADDNTDVRDYVRRLLSQRFDVEAVANGRDALAVVRARRPDLVLTDVMMPELDGFGLLSAIRADPALRDVPVILLSARAGEDASVEGVEAGADDYLVKPFSARELMARVTTHLQLARVRREALEQLQEADRRKDEFLAILAHELRNPLAPIRTGLELIRLGGDKPGAVERVRPMMERQVGHMVRLIDDLLDVSRITSGKIQLQRELTPLDELVHSAVEANRSAIDSAGISLTVQLPADPCYLHVDRTRFVQVLSNLLHNAAKFTESGGVIAISSEVTMDEGNGAFLALKVTDTGVGMTAELLPHVFDLFVQGEGPGHGKPGLGIGLALARRLIEMHGGRVEAASEGLGRGSSFVIQVPVVRSVAPVDTVATAGGAPSSVGRRVLVIDDNRDAADTLAELVRTLGGVAVTANDGELGAQTAAGFLPDVVLLDIGMPGIDGYETCSWIRRACHYPVFIVALTGWGQEQDKDRALRAGFDAHMTKPADPSVLARLLAEPTTERSQLRTPGV